MADVLTKPAEQLDRLDARRKGETLKERMEKLHETAATMAKPFWPRVGNVAGNVVEGIAHGIGTAFRWTPWLIYCLFILSLLGLAYFEVTSEGWRLTLPTLGKKLYKLNVPGLQAMEFYKGWNKIDLANCMALLLEFATFWAYDTILKIYLCRQHETHSRWNKERFQSVVGVLAGGVLLFDCYLFYTGTQSLMWGSSGLSFGALVLTGGWAFLIVVCSLLSIQLQPLPKKEE